MVAPSIFPYIPGKIPNFFQFERNEKYLCIHGKNVGWIETSGWRIGTWIGKTRRALFDFIRTSFFTSTSEAGSSNTTVLPYSCLIYPDIVQYTCASISLSPSLFLPLSTSALPWATAILLCSRHKFWIAGSKFFYALPAGFFIRDTVSEWY